MKFNSQNGFTPQEAFLVKKAIQKNADDIANKQDFFADRINHETVINLNAPQNKKVEFSKDFGIAYPEGFIPEGNTLVNYSLLENLIANKEDSLRKIVDVEITQETEANILLFEKDFENKDFELSKILVFMSVPVDQGATSSTTGYFYLKSKNHGYNENSYGSVVYKTTTAFFNLFNIVSNIDGIPTFVNINDQIAFTPNLVRYSKTSFGTTAPGVEYGKINGIRLNINSGNFISGTKIVIYGA